MWLEFCTVGGDGQSNLAAGIAIKLGSWIVNGVYQVKRKNKSLKNGIRMHSSLFMPYIRKCSIYKADVLITDNLIRSYFTCAC